MRRHSLGTLLLALAIAAPAVAQQQQMPRGGGMFPEPPPIGPTDKPAVPRGGGMFPQPPQTQPSLPSTQPLPPQGRRPVIIVTPGWQRPGNATSDPRWYAVQQALSGTTGIGVHWSSSGSFGTVTPVAERVVSGMNCRELKLSVNSMGQKEEGLATYCITPAGEWMLVGP